MITALRSRVERHRASCRRQGHAWTDRCYPVACSRCGTTAPGALLADPASEPHAA